MLDYGPDNYAGVTFHNTGDRVLLIGWMSNWAYAQSVPTAPWRSAMTLPRALSLVAVDGKAMLSQSVPSVFDGNTLLDGDWALDLTAAWYQANGVLKLHFSAENQPSFALTLSNDSGDGLNIGYNATEQRYYIDRRYAGQSSFSSEFPIRATAPRIVARHGTDISLYFDNGSVELFADGGTTTMSGLFFPNMPYTNVSITGKALAIDAKCNVIGLFKAS